MSEESMLRWAYALMVEFHSVIEHSLDGDHPDRQEVLNWLERYEEWEQER